MNVQRTITRRKKTKLRAAFEALSKFDFFEEGL